jgi:hypothetical protein
MASHFHEILRIFAFGGLPRPPHCPFVVLFGDA